MGCSSTANANVRQDHSTNPHGTLENPRPTRKRNIRNASKQEEQEKKDEENEKCLQDNENQNNQIKNEQKDNKNNYNNGIQLKQNKNENNKNDENKNWKDSIRDSISESKNGDEKQYELPLSRKEIRKKLDFDKIDLVFANSGFQNFNSLQEYIKFLTKECTKQRLNDFSKAYVVYKIICSNIEYDTNSENNNETISSLENAFSKKKTSIPGFAKLFALIMEKLNIPVKIINGYEREINGQSKRKLVWNIIYINGNGYLIETVWGSGNIVNGKWRKEFCDYYFCPNPEEFVFSHFPEVSSNEDVKKYTLLNGKNNICNSTEEYDNLVKIKRNFFLYSLKEIIPNTYNLVLDDLNRAQIIIKHSKRFNKSTNLICDVIKSDSNQKQRYKGNYIEGDMIKFKIYFKDKGEYELKFYILIAEPEEKLRKLLAIQKVVVKYDLYQIKLISPNKDEIYKGSFTDFTFEVSLMDSYDNSNAYINEKYLNNLYINTYGKKIKLKNNANFYKGESLYILNPKVQISCYNKLTKGFSNILKIKTQNAQGGKKLSYPYFFELTDDMILFEPVCQKLEKGKKYNFKIKTSQITQLIIINNEERNFVEKDDDNLFEIKDLEVKEGELKIYYTKKGNESYILAYMYSVQ